MVVASRFDELRTLSNPARMSSVGEIKIASRPRCADKRTMPAKNTILVTGASGLIGSEVSTYFAHQGYQVHGVDNNQRAVFFGPQGDTRWNQQRLERGLPAYRH